MPPVSIIMNVRNGSATLREALDSVFAQSFEDWELVIWDDCSTDDSAAIVGEYRDQRIHYFRSEHTISLGKARQKAIEQATGEWLAFLDQDDIWLPLKLESQLALAQENVGLIYGRTVRFYPSGLERDYDQAHEFKLLPEGSIFSLLFTYSCFPAMSSAMFRRAAVEKAGPIPQQIDIIPDYWLYVAIAHHHGARAVQEVVCRYRMHPGSMSQTHAIGMHAEALWLISQWEDALDPKTVVLAKRRHHTAIALEQMRSSQSAWRGFSHLLRQGSLPSQLIRPLMFVFHLVRRNTTQPCWRTLGSARGPGDPRLPLSKTGR